MVKYNTIDELTSEQIEKLIDLGEEKVGKLVDKLISKDIHCFLFSSQSNQEGDEFETALAELESEPARRGRGRPPKDKTMVKEESPTAYIPDSQREYSELRWNSDSGFLFPGHKGKDNPYKPILIAGEKKRAVYGVDHGGWLDFYTAPYLKAPENSKNKFMNNKEQWAHDVLNSALNSLDREGFKALPEDMKLGQVFKKYHTEQEWNRLKNCLAKIV